MSEWKPIETAPKDGTIIIAYCQHNADPYFIPGLNRLTAYGANAEGLSHVDDGVHLVCWHESIDEGEYLVPAWWELYWDCEVAANPTHWMPLPEPPEDV